MNFKDEKISGIKKSDVDEIFRMIVEYLCGEQYHGELSETEKGFLSNLLTKGMKEGLNYEQFNELLLLVDQDRVSEAFFKFFFEKEKINFEELKKGIIKFRGFALLRYGNFRFAYKHLIQKNMEGVKEALKPYCGSEEKIREKFIERPKKALEIEKIRKNHTWYNGYIIKRDYESQAVKMRKQLESGKTDSYSYSWDELKSFANEYEKMGINLQSVERTALKNTDIYLTWDYMDVYIATSMRHKWEFEETYDFINKVFNDESLKQMNLRYFDPTQSLCKNRIDKGLIESLMLKRAICTIYMAQEADTMGKDSELAATLAQGKTVIAYVPYIDVEEHIEKLKGYPLDFFKLRFLIHRAERLFDEEICRRKLEACDSKFGEKIDAFIKELDEYRSRQPFSFWGKKEGEFKRNSELFSKICRLLAISEHYSFEKRANTLKSTHPLSIQVHLESGVANGVLVVRDSEQCAKLLYKILTNSVDFIIKKDNNITILEEEISGCPFRVVTDYEKLANSFWNFYLISKQ